MSQTVSTHGSGNIARTSATIRVVYQIGL